MCPEARKVKGEMQRIIMTAYFPFFLVGVEPVLDVKVACSVFWSILVCSSLTVTIVVFSDNYNIQQGLACLD